MRNMTKKIVFGVAIVAVAALVMAPSASASCPGSRTANTYSSSGTAYWHLPAGDVPGTLVGQAWQLGSPGTFNSMGGPIPCQGILYFSGPGNVNLGANFGECGFGCPTTGSTLAVAATHTQPNGASAVLIATVVERTGTTSNFDYGDQGDHNLVRLPAPKINGSGPRAGNILPITVSVPTFLTAGNGLYGPNAGTAISGYKVVAALSTGEPSRDAAVYNATVTGGTLAAPGGAPVTNTSVQLDCGSTPGVDGWVALQIQFENGGVAQSAVSKPMRVHCQGALADPKYKPIRGKKVGQQ
jgi:hypothetical protein